MKYWLYFAAKLSAAVGVVYGLLHLVPHLVPKPEPLTYGPGVSLSFTISSTTFAVLLVWLIGAGLLYSSSGISAAAAGLAFGT